MFVCAPLENVQNVLWRCVASLFKRAKLLGKFSFAFSSRALLSIIFDSRGFFVWPRAFFCEVDSSLADFCWTCARFVFQEVTSYGLVHVRRQYLFLFVLRFHGDARGAALSVCRQTLSPIETVLRQNVFQLAAGLERVAEGFSHTLQELLFRRFRSKQVIVRQKLLLMLTWDGRSVMPRSESIVTRCCRLIILSGGAVRGYHG